MNGMGSVHFVDFRGNNFAGAAARVFFIDTKILDFQAADGSGHPAVLIAMIVDAAVLADFPADGHALEEIVFKNEIAGVVAFGEEEVFFDRFGTDGVANDVVLNIFERKIALGDRGEAFDPVGDGEWLDGELFWHGKKIIPLKRSGETRKEEIRERNTIFCRVIRGGTERRRVAGTFDMELLGKSKDELREICVAMGEPAYRGGQIYHALYAERKLDATSMTNLPAALREKLAKEATISLPVVKQRFVSTDGSVRYLFELGTGEKTFSAEGAEKRRPLRAASVEAVFMPSEGRQTICVSTQAGCAVDCQFCMTAQLGLIRNLSAGEILAQVLLPLEEHKEKLAPRTNIVLMGQGEPLLNYDAVMAAMRILLDNNGMAIAPRHATLSTSGIVPGIERLAGEALRPKLAISLNASCDEQRDVLMPINRKYPLSVLLEACKKFPRGAREYVTFEYVLLGGVNDSPEDARRVAKMMTELGRVKVNLIPWNPGALPFAEPDQGRVAAFHKILLDRGVPVFTRYSRGRDVMAACGQLALTQIENASASAPVAR
jgi:23S rRNA (adenine2503-C2)-methyltransferase